MNVNGPGFIYPGGTPSTAFNINFAYNENYLLYADGAGEEYVLIHLNQLHGLMQLIGLMEYITL